MILVKIELHSARTGKVTEIGRMKIINAGDGSTTRGNYVAQIMRRGTPNHVQKTVEIFNYPRLSYTVWELVRRVLHYNQKGATLAALPPPEPSDDLSEEDITFL